MIVVRWGIYETDTGVHVMPIDDVRPHEVDTDCACGPRRQPYPDDGVIVHDAWDRRDVLENLGR